MRHLKLLLVFALLLMVGGAWGQDTLLTAKEIAPLKELAKYNTRWNTFLNIWAILGPLLAVLVTWLGLRKKVADWAEKEITQKATEKFGVDWATVKQLVDEKKRHAAIKAKRLAIVNKEIGRRQDMVTMLDNYGFKNPPPQFFNWTEFNAKFDHNQFDLVILDNHDGQLTETELQQVMEKYQFPYVLYTVKQTSQTFFEKYKDKVKFAQIQQNIPDYIAQSF